MSKSQFCSNVAVFACLFVLVFYVALNKAAVQHFLCFYIDVYVCLPRILAMHSGETDIKSETKILSVLIFSIEGFQTKRSQF